MKKNKPKLPRRRWGAEFFMRVVKDKKKHRSKNLCRKRIK